MMSGAAPRHLIVLAADKHIASVLETLLSRPSDLGIHAMSFDVRRHPESDPGCRTRSAEFLRPLINSYRRALVVFDHRGCGDEEKSPAEVREEVEDELGRNGWRERSRAIVIDPELESWVWSRSGRVAHVLGWGRSFEPLREWLQAEGFWPAPQLKPSDPKRAVEQASAARERCFHRPCSGNWPPPSDSTAAGTPLSTISGRPFKPGFRGRASWCRMFRQRWV